ITLIATIGSVPVSAALAGKPGPAGLLPALHGIHNGTNDAGGESEEIMESAEQFNAVRTAPGIKVSPAAFAAATAAAARLAPPRPPPPPATTPPPHPPPPHH